MRRRCCRNASTALSRRKVRRRQFTQLRLVDDQRQTGIATRHGMADPVAFGGVEKQHLIRLGDGLIMAQVAHINAAIRKHQLCGRALFRTLMRQPPWQYDVSDRNGWRFQQRSSGKFRHAFGFVS